MSVTRPAGFAANGMASGIKPGGALDLAVVFPTSGPVPAAAVFTTNRAAAAPVVVSRRNLAASRGLIGAVLANSGCANAATGHAGIAVAERATELAGSALGVPSRAVIVCSTGVIGAELPVSPFESHVSCLVAGAGPTAEGSQLAARAIMTTDTRPKEACFEGRGFRVAGIGKGAAMLAPHMATMLAILTTDAACEPRELDRALRAAVEGSFHEMSVDGATSTNDTVVVLASGASGVSALPGELSAALGEVCGSLARQMVLDAEGATKLVEVSVSGAADDAEARRAARRIAESPLVKCSWFGADPNWGRLVAELGMSVAGFELDKVSVAYGPVTVFDKGRVTVCDPEELGAYLKGREIEIHCEVGLGPGRGRMVSSDLSFGYVEENMGRS